MEPRTQSCFFIEDLQVDYVLSLQYTVLSTKSGNQRDIRTATTAGGYVSLTDIPWLGGYHDLHQPIYIGN